MNSSRVSCRAVALVAATLALSACAHRRADLNRPGAQLNFGVRAAEMDLWREARFRFERAVQLNPDDPGALNNLAVACEGSGDFEKARETYLRALRIDKSNQYVQKNYSRFMEFYARFKKRESGDAVPAATSGATPAPATSPVVSPPAPAPPETPAAAPPDDASSPAPAPTPQLPAPADQPKGIL